MVGESVFVCLDTSFVTQKISIYLAVPWGGLGLGLSASIMSESALPEWVYAGGHEPHSSMMFFFFWFCDKNPC